ncbi:MAG TPA: hypothetical protein VF204_17880 [Streptosporangiaceae bacterium]
MDQARRRHPPGAVPHRGAVCAGARFSLALSTGGQVYAWGDNTDGQSGDGTHLPKHPTPVPVKLASRTQVTAIACGATILAAPAEGS